MAKYDATAYLRLSYTADQSEESDSILYRTIRLQKLNSVKPGCFFIKGNSFFCC